MTRLSLSKCASVGAILMGGLHAAWAGLVASGYAQLVMDFIFRLHFIEPVYQIVAFDLRTAAMLVGFTGAIGAVAGLMVGLVVNAARSKS